MGFQFKERLAYFFEYGAFHGLRYLGERSSYFGKVFWVLAIGISLGAMVLIFNLTIISYKQDAININIDTSYLHWENVFPAVSICFTPGKSTAKIKQYMTKYMNEHQIKKPRKNREVTYYKFVQKYVFLSPHQIIEKFDYCETLNKTCGVDVEVFQNMFFPKHCSQLMNNVTYLGVQYDDCAEIFKYMKTEMGDCFVANSIYSYDMDTSRLPLKYDRSHFERKLSFNYNVVPEISLVFYVHSPENLPYFNDDPITLGGRNDKSYSVSTIQTINSVEIKDEPIDERKCRFPDERLPGSVFPYSFSSCFTDLRIQTEMEVCNCTMHVAPQKYRPYYCDYYGLICIRNAVINDVTKRKQHVEETACMPSCIEMDIKKISNVESFRKDELPLLTIEVQDTPILRYIRNVATTKLDVVVSIGGIAGLFSGASILSMVEFFYIWFIRTY